jgi:AcrR family transcriptional regulator
MPAAKFQRRSEARPGEIAAAALEVFAEKGFAAARLDDIAARAGISKGALYLYFESKEALFGEVVRTAVLPNLELVRAMAAAAGDLPFPTFIARFTALFAATTVSSPVGGIAKMVVGESRNFPELARLWHDEIVAPMLGLVTGLIEAAQARGEVRQGEPRLYAVQLVAPFLLNVIWRETFVPVGAPPIDVESLARQHAQTLARGLLTDPEALP